MMTASYTLIKTTLCIIVKIYIIYTQKKLIFLKSKGFKSVSLDLLNIKLKPFIFCQRERRWKNKWKNQNKTILFIKLFKLYILY